MNGTTDYGPDPGRSQAPPGGQRPAGRRMPPMHPIDLDHNATTPLLPEAWEAMRAAPAGNPASAHAAGRKARQALEDAREKVAALLGAHPDEVTFTSGATEANNLAVFGLARQEW